MATIALAAVGTAVGGYFGGTVLGLSAATIGRAVGAAIGQRIDQQILGGGSEAIETGRIDRFRLTGATEGADVQQIYGRMRVAGQVIWASQFKERSKTSGGKGSSGPETKTYSYTVSLAIALCEGRVSRIGRIWADGTEVTPSSLNMRLYEGTMDQQPDPKMTAVEGADNVPAYRGTAYVVLEDLALEQFGNRIPQLTFEVIRAAPQSDDIMGRVGAVQIMPTGGAYALAVSQLTVSDGARSTMAINTNSPMGGSDFSVAMDGLQGDLPNCASVTLPVTWYGNDLRCGSCEIQPMIVDTAGDALDMPWQVSGITRGNAVALPQAEGKAIYGGTPADAAVLEAVADLQSRGMAVLVQPTLLMTQAEDNTLPDPWTGETGQSAQPWCGRITTSLAFGQIGSPDGTATAAAQVAAFFGTAAATDFVFDDGQLTYSGPATGGYRRFILHYAHLCAAAGGVDAFSIGTDLAGLTRIRGTGQSFPAVTALQDLAADVRTILGANCKIGYAADLDEYQGYTPTGTQDRYFPLDDLWADPAIDFIGVNARLPLADWREGEDHADADHGSIYNLDYLTGNVAGGEGYDWTYPSPEARAAQLRHPVNDPFGEDWVARRKDFAGWWENSHHPRIGGIRHANATAWVPRSKPIWFTALGCAAVDKGANEVRPVAEAAMLPTYSNGNRDDLMQMQYLRAIHDHFAQAENNPFSDSYGGPMLDTTQMHVTGWDPRPYPYWPGNQSMWSDGAGYVTGAMLNGRATNRTLASVVAEICEQSGVAHYDVSALFGVVRGYTVSNIGTGRAALQPLMLAHGFDAVEREGVLVFRNRRAVIDHVLDDNALALDPERDQALGLTRAAAAEVSGRVQFAHLNADGDYDAIAAEAILPDETTISVTRNELPVLMTRKEGVRTVTRWLQEARVARDTAAFALPPSLSNVGAGDIVTLDTANHQGRYRIDRVEETGVRLIEATRVDAEVYRAQLGGEEPASLRPFVGPTPAEMVFMDLPLLTGDEQPHAPYVAASGNPWPGNIALYGAPQDSDYALKEIMNEAATLGVTQGALGRGPVGIWDRQDSLQVALVAGALSSATEESLLAGANTIAIGGGSADAWEVIQFAQATPIAEGVFALQGLLRGQSGSWGVMPDTWPVGSKVVLMDGVPTQLSLPSAARGTTRHFRYGPASQPISDASYRYETHSFAGNGLRPYPVVHLRAEPSGGDVSFNWIRCTRIDGDIWADGDVPLGEDRERYIIRVHKGGVVQREVTVSDSNWTYDSSRIAADIGGGAYQVGVAQLSDRFGAGPFTTLDLTA